MINEEKSFKITSSPEIKSKKLKNKVNLVSNKFLLFPLLFFISASLPPHFAIIPPKYWLWAIFTFPCSFLVSKTLDSSKFSSCLIMLWYSSSPLLSPSITDIRELSRWTWEHDSDLLMFTCYGFFEYRKFTSTRLTSNWSFDTRVRSSTFVWDSFMSCFLFYCSRKKFMFSTILLFFIGSFSRIYLWNLGSFLTTNLFACLLKANGPSLLSG